ncbi:MULTISPECIES: hypothetical protein [unclassified Listeria]|uniref:hypothetical protein n=1 Tax=unclassified Listeria TaxID=2642072 RepID=UPI0021018980|nr:MULTISPECIES: hypothetical protein [unclassified Listeria]
MRKNTLLILLIISLMLSLITSISGYKIPLPPLVLVIFTAICLALGLMEWRAKHFYFAYVAFFCGAFLCMQYILGG